MRTDITQAAAIFFDWDGTLVDSLAFLHKAHNYTREQLGIEPFSLEIFKGYFGQPREILYKKLYGDHGEAAKAHFESFVLANHMKELHAADGAQDILEWFAQVGIPCGVVTNKKATLVRAEIKNFGWDKYFVSVVGAGEAEEDKPSPAPLALAIEKAGISSPHNEIWYVGDTDNDLKCANDAGCPALLIAKEAEHKTLSELYSIEAYFQTCQTFYDFLLQSGANSLKR